MDYKTILKSVIKEVEEDILPDLPIKDFRIRNIKRKSPYLGYYRKKSCFDIPLIILNKKEILDNVSKKFSLKYIILTTILHELAHALQDLKQIPLNEVEAEAFAIDYWRFDIINTI